MADLLEGTPGLKNNEKSLEQAVDTTVGTAASPENVSAENLEVLPAQVEKIREEMVAAPIEAPGEPVARQDLGTVLEESHSGAAKLGQTDKEVQKKNLSLFMEGKLGPGDLQITLNPNTESAN